MTHWWLLRIIRWYRWSLVRNSRYIYWLIWLGSSESERSCLCPDVLLNKVEFTLIWFYSFVCIQTTSEGIFLYLISFSFIVFSTFSILILHDQINMKTFNIHSKNCTIIPIELVEENQFNNFIIYLIKTHTHTRIILQKKSSRKI